MSEVKTKQNGIKNNKMAKCVCVCACACACACECVCVFYVNM